MYIRFVLYPEKKNKKKKLTVKYLITKFLVNDYLFLIGMFTSLRM